MKYVGTQFISFTINTIGGIDDKGECEGQPIDPNNGFCYLGNSENITKDVYHCLGIVEQTLHHRLRQDAFRESPDIDHANNILKIFMMPKFFWRGPNGAYSTSVFLNDDDDDDDDNNNNNNNNNTSLYLQVADRLRELVADPFFNDFLFVFGTIVAAESPGDLPGKPWEMDNATDVDYYNLAPVIKGGPHHHQHSYIVTKRYISGADFLSRTTLPNPKKDDKHLYSQVSEAMSHLFEDVHNSRIITDNILELDGLRIGLGICLDHRMGALWNHIRSYQLPLVDVLLVTSAGMGPLNEAPIRSFPVGPSISRTERRLRRLA
jgi:hypothetical protein